MYPIEENIPLPENRGRTPKYPFHDMKPGDSFLVPREEFKGLPPRTVYNRIDKAARVHGLKYGKKFAARTQEDGIRCWRVE